MVDRQKIWGYRMIAKYSSPLRITTFWLILYQTLLLSHLEWKIILDCGNLFWNLANILDFSNESETCYIQLQNILDMSSCMGFIFKYSFYDLYIRRIIRTFDDIWNCWKNSDKLSLNSWVAVNSDMDTLAAYFILTS